MKGEGGGGQRGTAGVIVKEGKRRRGKVVRVVRDGMEWRPTLMTASGNEFAVIRSD